jgi:hypothetical protein
MAEPVAFEAMDGDKDGRLSLSDLLAETMPSWIQSKGAGLQWRTARSNDVDGIEGGVGRWLLAVKYAALSSWFSTPVPLRRRVRGPPGGQGSSAPLFINRPETPAGGAMIVVIAVAEGATSCSSHGAAARQEVPDPVRQCWAPCESDLKEVDEKMKIAFWQNSSFEQHSERCLNKSDFFRLLGDIPPIGLGEDPDAQQLTRAQLSRIFDEVQSSAPNSITFSKGLTFESFRLALFKVLLSMGIHFRHLIDDAMYAKAWEEDG